MDGRALRSTVSRSSHAIWDAPADRDAVALLRAHFATLIPDLVPLRIERMRRSPFAFFRGSDVVMAADLARTPVTGVDVQLCGDAHVANFGGYVSPERRLVFDVNDFDESARGPWEWDVKRLAASVVLAGREREHRQRACDAAARAAVATYRDRMADYAAQPVIDVWFAAIDLSGAVRTALDGRTRRAWIRMAESTQRGDGLSVVPRIARGGDGIAFVDDPPGLVRLTAEPDRAEAHALLDVYRATLRADARMLLDRFTVADVARKVSGVGSVGTWAALLLLRDGAGAPVILQAKEARAPAFGPFVAAQPHASDGERVVTGQRLMQAAPDALLGWSDAGGRSVYVRQYHDVKASPDRFALREDELADYATHCGWALARAHARTGDARTIAEYVGRGSRFVDAVVAFARTYADQTARDFAAFSEAFAPAEPPAPAEDEPSSQAVVEASPPSVVEASPPSPSP